jgi:hypothetical protein
MPAAKAVSLSSLVAKDTSSIKKYATIPVEVEAVQFQGWDNAAIIHSWSKGALFVPEGYEHALRIPEEYDEQGHLLAAASEFLVLKNASGAQSNNGELRVDKGSWIVKTKDGAIHVYPEELFKQYYSEMMF